MTLSVLAIDDSRTMRMLVSQTLKGAGFDVVTAEDGIQGVETFATRRFDAVITDINMPNLDGFGVIEAIRQSPKNRRVPILVLTTESSEAFRNRARGLGATGWLVKPFDEDGLVNTVRLVTGQG
ncbi:response regulator [Donghicola sp. C2-DW-16]|uniref:Response regulator n=1 Tax=Donghicola mangrovi TaxID=2729614 RepID=A0ABX2PID0_9RHOB|nr:response regulator [Donghicola mangrovi]NVO28517.1 response regulator [Donghicola mangrovi]